jgi:hypothetical protein
MSIAAAIEPKNAAVEILLRLMKTVTVQLKNAVQREVILGEAIKTARVTHQKIVVFTTILLIPL